MGTFAAIVPTKNIYFVSWILTVVLIIEHKANRVVRTVVLVLSLVLSVAKVAVFTDLNILKNVFVNRATFGDDRDIHSKYNWLKLNIKEINISLF
jgi:hypothetical protein